MGVNIGVQPGCCCPDTPCASCEDGTIPDTIRIDTELLNFIGVGCDDFDDSSFELEADGSCVWSLVLPNGWRWEIDAEDGGLIVTLLCSDGTVSNTSGFLLTWIVLLDTPYDCGFADLEVPFVSSIGTGVFCGCAPGTPDSIFLTAV